MPCALIVPGKSRKSQHTFHFGLEFKPASSLNTSMAHLVPRALPPSPLIGRRTQSPGLSFPPPNWAAHLVPRAPLDPPSPLIGRRTQSPNWAAHLVPRALPPPPPLGGALSPQGSVKDNVIKLTFLLTFWYLRFVLFCVRLDSRCLTVFSPLFFWNVLSVVLLYFFLFIPLFSCWFTLRNSALGKVSCCLRNRTCFTEFKRVNFFQILIVFSVRP